MDMKTVDPAGGGVAEALRRLKVRVSWLVLSMVRRLVGR